MTEENIILEQGTLRAWSQPAKVGRHHKEGKRTGDIALERQPRPTGVCLADAEVSPEIG